MANSLRQLATHFRSLASDPAAAIYLVAPEIEATAVADVQTRMRAGKQPDGAPQPPIKHSRESGNTGPPLVDTGRLLASVTATTAKTTLTISASGPGARRHQKTRPFVGLSKEGRVTVKRLIMVGWVRRLRGNQG